MVRVKVCGITRLDDAMTAVEACADALGFIFVEGTPRFVTPERVAPIVRALPPFVTPVDRKSTRLNSSHSQISYAVFCLKKKKQQQRTIRSSSSLATTTSTFTPRSM